LHLKKNVLLYDVVKSIRNCYSL